MLISDSHQFIFVHIRKAAGSSIRDTLEPLSLVKPEDNWSKIKSRFLRTEKDYKKYAFRQHDSITVAKRLMPPELFESYFKFAFVRNPWDRLVSEYEFIRRRPDHGRHSKVMKMGFEKYIVYQSKRFDAHQINMLADKDGNLLMDFIGKFENLHDDWNRITEKLGIKNKELTHRKKAGIKDYDSYYTEESRALVSDLWKRDIEAFGYH
jgi:hypothetical protein